MAKPRMTDLGDFLVAKKTPAPQADPQADPEPAPEPYNPAPPKAPAATKTHTPAYSTVNAASARDPIAGTPRYLTLVRKELRITQAQADQISSTVRALNLTRRGEGERITDNTLVRVAIGLLLERLDDLHGTTEAELFQSLGMGPAE